LNKERHSFAIGTSRVVSATRELLVSELHDFLVVFNTDSCEVKYIFQSVQILYPFILYEIAVFNGRICLVVAPQTDFDQTIYGDVSLSPLGVLI